MKMPMQYLVDIHNTQNTASLQNFLKNDIDLSNNFFPGIDKVIGGKVQTYYPQGAVHAVGEHRVARAEHDARAAERRGLPRALAMSINIDQIVKADYGNIVEKANPTGLLPTWNKWIDKAQANKLGFKYNIAGAKALLAANGYKDTNGDGYVENKAGQYDQPEADRPERLVGLDDRDPDHRRQREGRGHQDHAGVPGLQRARRRAQLRQVRPRDQQRQAARPDAVHLLRLPLPPADRRFADVRELLPLHRGGRRSRGR